ncbi:TetR/AcrR family transcriptional regulator [Lawsonibacter sp. LCP25S3_G6]|uniref:TetR/AcrR family transcriptional regulator n=1 Tax=unclassified Lawsonibacter TaxID=2617946 RepID=UPI003F9E84A2
MPKVAYSEEDRLQIRQALVVKALELMAKQGIQHTTVEQIYQAVGISRTFFYTFFPSKEDLIVETFYLQQPKILAYAQSLMSDPALTWKEGVVQFFRSCCYGEESGIAVMTIQEQQLLFHRLSPASYQLFRQKQEQLFSQLLLCFGIQPSRARIQLFTNISLTAIVVRRAIPDTLPFFVPDAREETVEFQIRAIADYLEQLRDTPLPA